MRDTLGNAASLESVVGLSSLEGTDDDASRDIISVTVGGGENDVIVDQTGSTAAFPLDEVWVLALGRLISADNTTVCSKCVLASGIFLTGLELRALVSLCSSIL